LPEKRAEHAVFCTAVAVLVAEDVEAVDTVEKYVRIRKIVADPRMQNLVAVC